MASYDVSRRKLLSASVAIGSVAVSGQPAYTRSVTGTVPWEPDQAAAPPVALPDASPPTSFFTASERAFIDAAVSRLIPQDDLGGGARKRALPFFSIVNSPARLAKR